MNINPVLSVENEGRIGFFVNNISQFDMAYKACKKSKYKYYIFFSCNFDSISNYEPLDNVSVVIEKKNFEIVVKRCRLFITSVGHENYVLPKEFYLLKEAALESGCKIIDVPHGLFQWGINLSDDSWIIDMGSNIFGGGVVDSFADKKISWFGEDGVGYPKYSRAEIIKNKVVPDYTVITSNTNWYLYDDQSQRDFYVNLFRYIEDDGGLFIWAPHPSELKENQLSCYLVDYRPSNLFLYGIDKDIYFEGIDTTESLIKYASKGISTISTCLADFEVYKTPVKVFSPKKFSELVALYSNISFFEEGESIKYSKYLKLKSKLIKMFDVKAFDEELGCLL